MSLNKIINTNKKAQLVVLVDPDKFNPKLIDLAAKSRVSFFLVGGSSLKKNNLSQVVSQIKKRSKKPVIIFPGNEKQICKNADGLLLLSLISGRNPEFLIGKHVKAVSAIKKNKLETLSVGYILVDGDKISTTQKVTNTKALSSSKTKLILDTAIAGELLGLKAIYLEAGSGAKTQVNSKLITTVKKSIHVPLFVGGGIDSEAKARAAIKAGANFVVIGNALEKNLYLLSEIEKAFT
ncbi:MAG: geranylgeranylglyceryl/heptaprenylglyceryl phosphate synthase [Bacteroidia bacterium]|nr:geranylgeranylglyceryl/heptaprenylglyceryl phosphate synthase [Bacteroidia bacterium]